MRYTLGTLPLAERAVRRGESAQHRLFDTDARLIHRPRGPVVLRAVHRNDTRKRFEPCAWQTERIPHPAPCSHGKLLRDQLQDGPVSVGDGAGAEPQRVADVAAPHNLPVCGQGRHRMHESACDTCPGQTHDRSADRETAFPLGPDDRVIHRFRGGLKVAGIAVVPANKRQRAVTQVPETGALPDRDRAARLRAAHVEPYVCVRLVSQPLLLGPFIGWTVTCFSKRRSTASTGPNSDLQASI